MRWSPWLSSDRDAAFTICSVGLEIHPTLHTWSALSSYQLTYGCSQQTAVHAGWWVGMERWELCTSPQTFCLKKSSKAPFTHFWCNMCCILLKSLSTWHIHSCIFWWVSKRAQNTRLTGVCPFHSPLLPLCPPMPQTGWWRRRACTHIHPAC